MSNVFQHIVLNLIFLQCCISVKLQFILYLPLSAPLPEPRSARVGPRLPLPLLGGSETPSPTLLVPNLTLGWSQMINCVSEQINSGGLIFKIWNSDLEP